MQTKHHSGLLAATIALLPLASMTQAAIKIDSSTVTAFASSEFANIDPTLDRSAAKTLDGETSPADGPPFQIFVSVAGNPGTPSDWRQNATAASGVFGQGNSWLSSNADAITDVADDWLIFDLGQDTELDTMNIFGFALETAAGEAARSIRDAKIYYSTEASGVGTNAPGNDTPFDATQFTLATTLTGDTEVPRPTGGESAMAPLGVPLSGITARYIAIDIDANWGWNGLVGVGEVQFFSPQDQEDDPTFSLDSFSEFSDFVFGELLSTTDEFDRTRTLSFIVNSPSDAESVTVNSISLTNNESGAFTVEFDDLPVTLENEDFLDVIIIANVDTPGEFTGTLEIETTSSGGIVASDFNDKSIPVSSTVLPSFSNFGPPSLIGVTSPETTGTSSFDVRNENPDTTFNLTLSLSEGSGFSIVSPASPVAVAPGATQTIEVQWNTESAATTPVESATLSIVDSANGISEDVTVSGALVNPLSKVLPNFDFEIPGTDPASGTSTDNFASWTEELGGFGAAPEGVIDVPGLITGTGTTAVYLVGDVEPKGEISNALSNPLNNFVVEADFAIAAFGSSRRFNMFLRNIGQDSPAALTELNIRYQANINAWQVFASVPPFSGWQTVIDMTDNPLEGSDPNGNFSLEDEDDAKITYKIRVIGSGWGTEFPSYSLAVINEDGDVIAQSASINDIWRGAAPTTATSMLTHVTFSQQFDGAGLWVDNVCIDGSTIVTPAPPVSGITLSNPAFAAGNPNTVTLDIVAEGPVDIYRSTTLVPGSWGTAIATNVAPGNGIVIDTDAPAGTSFYIAVDTGTAAP